MARRGVPRGGWYGGGAALTDGFDPIGIVLLLALTAVADTIGVTVIDRRDLNL